MPVHPETAAAISEGAMQARAIRLRGIALVCGAVMIFACLDATAKMLSRHVPVPEIVWFRYVVHMLVMVALFAPAMKFGLVRSANWKIHVVRGTLLFGSSSFFMAALKYLPLAEAMAIGFVAPLLVTAFSVPFLKERVGPRRWAAILFGFAGMIVVVRPGGDFATPAVLLPCGMAVCYSLYQILTRKFSGGDSPVTSLFYTALMGSLLSSCVVPFFWVTPAEPWVLTGLIATGAIAGVGHYMLIKALETVPASVIAPFTYSQLVWGLILGFLVFGDFPPGIALIGMAMIVASGLYVFYREARIKRSA